MDPAIDPLENVNSTNVRFEPQQQSDDSDHQQNVEEPHLDPELSLSQALEDIDRFVDTFSTVHDRLEVPSSVESLLKMAEKMMSDYDSNKFGQNPEEDSSFFEILTRISKLINVFNQFAHDPVIVVSLNRASNVLHLSLSLLDGEFRTILESCNQCSIHRSHNNNIPDSKSSKGMKAPSMSLHRQDSERGIQSEPEPILEDEFPNYSQESISVMNKIATTMVLLGYERECLMAYNTTRRNDFNNELEKLGFNNISIEDVQKMQWDSLEGEIASWNEVLKTCYSLLLPKEQMLCESVFSERPSISQRLFSDLAFAVTVRFLNFAEAVSLTKRSTEKLFKFLDMYETLRDIIPAIYNTDSNELKSETSSAKSRLGEAAVSCFCDLENSIRRDHSKIPVPNGAVHPLTRYTMNYLKYACEYKDTLEQVFLQHKLELTEEEAQESDQSLAATSEINKGANDDGTPKTSPFAVQLNTIMDLLDESLEMKSKLYRDPALGFVFLMNNGRYILQKIKGSDDINDIMGAKWCRKRSADLRQYHKGYTRETWGRLLQCLNVEGLQVNGKVAKPVLKERFKMFNSMFEEIHRTQSTWVVSDDQLQSELRASVSAVVIPAYRSFIGRFQQYLSSGRQTEKYIKYQPEDIERLVDELFDGNPNSISRRRT